jgi:hypothetical protein
MEKNNLVELVEQRFNVLFEGKRLLGLKLDGFSHMLAYDGGDAEDDVEYLTYTSYAPEIPQDKKAAVIFNGIGHMSYQGNPFVHYWFTPNQR